jgi:hypothetical protein
MDKARLLWRMLHDHGTSCVNVEETLNNLSQQWKILDMWLQLLHGACGVLINNFTQGTTSSHKKCQLPPNYCVWAVKMEIDKHMKLICIRGGYPNPSWTFDVSIMPSSSSCFFKDGTGGSSWSICFIHKFVMYSTVYKRIYTLCQLCPTMYSTHIVRLVVVRWPEKEKNLAAIPSNWSYYLKSISLQLLCKWIMIDLQQVWTILLLSQTNIKVAHESEVLYNIWSFLSSIICFWLE